MLSDRDGRVAVVFPLRKHAVRGHASREPCRGEAHHAKIVEPTDDRNVRDEVDRAHDASTASSLPSTEAEGSL